MLSKPAHQRGAELPRLKLFRFIGALALLLSAVYLAVGGAAFHSMTKFGQLISTLPGAISMSPIGALQSSGELHSSEQFIVLNRYFQESIVVPVLVAVIAFWIWLIAYRRLVRPELRCSKCRNDLPAIRCPECGKVIRPIQGGLAIDGHAEDGKSESMLTTAEVQVGLKVLRGGGALLLLLSALYLLLGGIYHLVLPSIYRYIMFPKPTPPAASGLVTNVLNWDMHFRNGVLPGVILGAIGFCIWFIPYRRLARASWLCPSCSYDLSGMPCPECNAASDTE